MRLLARYLCDPLCWAVLIALLMLVHPRAAQDVVEPKPAETAETDEQGEDAGPMTIELDLDRLLFNNRGSNLQDPVWRLQASPGKRILMLPFTVDNVERTNKLSRFPITVRSGRFIGFVIPKPDLNNRGSDTQDLNRIIRAAPDELQQLLFERGDDGASQQQANSSPDEDAMEPTPETAPRLAREVVLHPDGTVEWSMDRSFHTGEVQPASDANPYGYKVDAEQLRAAQPPRPERITRNPGEDSRDFAQRKREQQLADREKQNAYRELRSTLRDLPETFREPAPTVLYAAIEVPDRDDLSLQGPAPLPWTLEAEKLELIKKLATGGKALQDERGLDISNSLINLIQGHPLDARAVAIATMRGRLAGQVESDDPGYKILSQLLQSDDISTRRIALYGVATTSPPTLASAKLIGVAGEAAAGEERKMLSFASLSKLFSTQTNDPDNARVLIDQVNQTIADPVGPAAARVIERVLDALQPDQGFNRSQASGETASAMIELLDLTGMTPEEFDGVAKAIISRAPDSPVAAGWLDHKLLGSTNVDLVSKTLSHLHEAQIKPPSTQEQLDQADAEPVADADTTLLSGTIPMARADHALIALFESSADPQQAAAWAVLGRFHIALPDAEPSVTPDGTQKPPADLALTMFQAIIEKARARGQVPVSVVVFITSQQDPTLTKPADEQLIELLADKSLQQKTALAALDAYVASPDRYSQALQALDSQKKQSLMEAVYASQDQSAPLMAGLIADNGPAMTWLTTYVKEQQQMPTPDAWAEMAIQRGEQGLLSSAASSDMVLCTAAAAALVVAAGGDEQQEIAFAQTVALMESRTNELVREQWGTHRNKIFAASFKRSQGTYQLLASIRQAQDSANQPDTAADEAEDEEAKVIDLGVVEFRAEGVELSLSVEAVTLSATPDQLGIRIDDAATLRSFNKPELSRVPPEQLKGPVDLLPEDGGAWSGHIKLRDGRVLSVTLEPVN